MSMQNGSKRSSPSIIARLMGLDVLPPPHIQLKPVENQHRRRTISADKSRGKQTYGGSLRKGGSIDEQRFKDVFEVVLDAADEGKGSTSLYQRRSVNANNNLTEAEMDFIRHKFIEAKRLSSHEKLRYSKEFIKFSNNKNHVDNFKNLKVEREFLGKSSHISPPQWHHGDCVDDLSKKQWKKTSGLKPTEIVVLKPNLGKPQAEAREDLRRPCTSNPKGNEDVFLLGNKSRDSREIARIVSRQLKTSCGNECSTNFDLTRFRGYTEDESSSSGSCDSSRARTGFSRKNHRRSLSSRSPESASKEAMRRMSERWKLAHSSEREIEIRRRNTLADMLATSDREARLASKRLERQAELQDPIGISSRDGWKDTGRRNFSKSRMIMHKERTCSHTIVLPKKLTTRDGLVKGSASHNYHFSDSSSSEINRASSSKSLKTQSSLSVVHAESDTESVSEDYEDAKSSTPSLEPLDSSAVTSLTHNDISGRQTEEADHCYVPQPQPQESAEEGDQPSPQTSSHDEFSSNSECFESLSADLQGLRMKLELLKRESDTYTEGDMIVSSEEDADQEVSSIATDEIMITHELQEDWKSLYLGDILANSRFSDLNPTSFLASWHSSESPLDPSLFDDLEKKYSGLKTSTRVKRKFVFDRINSEILELFEQLTDFKPTKVYPIWDISRIYETLPEVVTRKHMKERRLKELQLPNLEDSIEVIGKEIEEMLTDELIAELVVIRDCLR